MSKFVSVLSVTIDIFAPTFEDIRNYVIDYHKRNWTYKQIAQELHLSFGTISKILKAEFGSIEDVLEKKSVKISKESEAFSLFDKNKTLVQVKVELDIPTSEVAEYHKSYQQLRCADMYNEGYNKVKGNITSFLQLFDLMCGLGMKPGQVAEQVKYGNSLPQLQSIHAKMNKQVQDLASKHWTLDSQLQRMANEVQQYKNSLQFYNNECAQKINEIKSLCSTINRKKRVIRWLDNSKGYDRIKEAAKKETKLLLQDNRTLLALTVSTVLEAVRRYDATRELIFNIVTSSSATICEEPWIGSHKSRLVELSEHIQKEMAEQITKMTLSTVQSSHSESEISQTT